MNKQVDVPETRPVSHRSLDHCPCDHNISPLPDVAHDDDRTPPVPGLRAAKGAVAFWGGGKGVRKGWTFVYQQLRTGLVSHKRESKRYAPLPPSALNHGLRNPADLSLQTARGQTQAIAS